MTMPSGPKGEKEDKALEASQQSPADLRCCLGPLTLRQPQDHVASPPNAAGQSGNEIGTCRVTVVATGTFRSPENGRNCLGRERHRYSSRRRII
jgi:hypothetical protein